MRLLTLLVTVSVAHGASDPNSATVITWPEFFARVTTEGLVYSERLKTLDGRRVRLRGYAITHPSVPRGLLLSRDPYSDPHDVDETDVPYDAVGVVWRKGLSPPPLPARLRSRRASS